VDDDGEGHGKGREESEDEDHGDDAHGRNATNGQMPPRVAEVPPTVDSLPD
jgi:hypothetical protein